MSIVYISAEYLTTFVEGLLALLTIGLFCGWKSEKKKTLLILVLSLLYTIMVTALNTIEMFSMGTILIAILYVTGVSHCLSERKFGYRLLIAVLYFFCIAIIDSVVNIVTGVVLGDPSLPMHIVSTVGIHRTAYILIIKGLEVGIYAFLRSRIKEPPGFSLSGIVISVMLTLLAFFSVYYTYNAVLSLSVQKMQLSLALAWVAMLAVVIMLQLVFSSRSRQKEKERDYEMLQSVNAMIEENYENLERLYQENAKNVHDFKHHVNALDELLAEGEFEEARRYVSSLHEAGRRSVTAVFTGNAVIDAVLNLHLSMAQSDGIDFSVTAQPLPDLTLNPWELSVLFSNLLENAIDACKKVSGRSPWVRVKIGIANRLFLLEVHNTADSCPGEGEWKTTKSEKLAHGLGLHSVEDIVQKYHGNLKREYLEEGVVVVKVMCESVSTIIDSI